MAPGEECVEAPVLSEVSDDDRPDGAACHHRLPGRPGGHLPIGQQSSCSGHLDPPCPPSVLHPRLPHPPVGDPDGRPEVLQLLVGDPPVLRKKY